MRGERKIQRRGATPAEIQTENRRTTKKKIWGTKEWKDGVKEFTKGKSCEWCGTTERLLPHHPYRNTKDIDYLDLYLSGCVVLCNRCHFALHKGLVLCGKCRTRFHRLGTDLCYTCYVESNPRLAEEIEKRKEKFKNLRKKLNKKCRDKYKSTNPT